jgi:hypothetical protein
MRQLLDPGDHGLYPLGDLPGYAHGIRSALFRAEPTGEHRPPRAGEWYLSGAITAAYRAPGDLSTSYHIARIVPVEIVPATVRKVHESWCTAWAPCHLSAP